MPYPDTFEGFQVLSHEKWSDFEKKEVLYYSAGQLIECEDLNSRYSSNPSHSGNETLISKLYENTPSLTIHHC